ncbi:VOC family protein [Steroidobacter sp. S1-65]|uniref:VOC family protein n=1 Tax=Steroidobacter gossypii TaxID=2805490 RepID=A0ABS1WQE4_9GAMM|nr:VOC family protein [Steroidobacter gossypii]MBM0103197.1 VOC family protein [Steroidobacter gossypii]
MRIKLVSIFVDDQDKAVRFYTEVLSFIKKRDFPIGGARWIEVVSPEGPDDLMLILEPNSHPAASAYQAALLKDGIPCTAFESTDIHAEVKRLKDKGVTFTIEPTPAGEVIMAVFSDTCGNLIQMYQMIKT